MSPITLIIRPHCSPRTGKRVQGQFEARLDGKLICISHQPLLDGARVLLADGVDPATPIACGTRAPRLTPCARPSALRRN